MDVLNTQSLPSPKVTLEQVSAESRMLPLALLALLPCLATVIAEPFDDARLVDFTWKNPAGVEYMLETADDNPGIAWPDESTWYTNGVLKMINPAPNAIAMVAIGGDIVNMGYTTDPPEGELKLYWSPDRNDESIVLKEVSGVVQLHDREAEWRG